MDDDLPTDMSEAVASLLADIANADVADVARASFVYGASAMLNRVSREISEGAEPGEVVLGSLRNLMRVDLGAMPKGTVLS